MSLARINERIPKKICIKVPIQYSLILMFLNYTQYTQVKNNIIYTFIFKIKIGKSGFFLLCACIYKRNKLGIVRKWKDNHPVA